MVKGGIGMYLVAPPPLRAARVVGKEARAVWRGVFCAWSDDYLVLTACSSSGPSQTGMGHWGMIVREE